MTTLVWPAATTPTFRAAIVPRVVSTPVTAPAASRSDPGDLAILDDVDAERVGGARIAPGDRVVPRHAAAALQGRAEHRVAHRRDRC